MAAFPTNVKYDWRDLTETAESVTEGSKMERGIPKQRRIASDARVELALTVHFDSRAEALAFDSFFFDDINAGQDFFDFTHPRTGAVVQARVVGGEMGSLKFKQPTLEKSTRSFKLEYWRPTW